MCVVCICLCAHVYVCLHVPVYMCIVSMCVHICICVCVRAHVCADLLAWVEGAAAQFGFVSAPPRCSRGHQSGTKYSVHFLAWGFPNHAGGSHLNLNSMKGTPML